ncbi:hypothetical protein FHW83_005917 [Duganella sp. SG902]|uniref:hypothetical protein n=1 Tax=Duganella sp. SG902 TaxID=2587016 RepID=UPI00159DE62B|nr:hypothetical protein [Duganella sp. SG902]NVM80072.1 hypothetical protein [Duganella sp. SG902]
MKTESRKDPRVPIPLTQAEDEQLEQIRKDEARSRQSMAGIIYRLGLKAYKSQQPQQQN